MSRTLADMTPEEREQCVGMWCEAQSYGHLLVLARLEGNDARVTVPQGPYPHTAPLSNFTPRPDLPRAWNPDGTPVKGEWVEGHMWWGEDTDTMQAVDLVGVECLATGQTQGLDEWPDSVTPGEDVPVRRFITEWEGDNADPT